MDTETSLAEEKKDERTRLIAIVREIERFLGDGLVKVLFMLIGYTLDWSIFTKSPNFKLDIGILVSFCV